MPKLMKFDAQLADKILAGEKTATWRLWDDKDLQAGDEVELYARGLERVFARAKLTSVVEKPIGEMDEDDMRGHNRPKSLEELCEGFAKTYAREVTPETLVKIIRFVLKETIST